MPNSAQQPVPNQPPCPKCGGDMWDNRANKRNPKSPDFKCKDKDGCDGVIWPPKGGQRAAAPQGRQPVNAGPAIAGLDGPDYQATPARAAGTTPVTPIASAPSAAPASAAPVEGSTRKPIGEVYIGCLDFVLKSAVPRFATAGIPVTDVAIAAMTATLFIAKKDGR